MSNICSNPCDFLQTSSYLSEELHFNGQTTLLTMVADHLILLLWHQAPSIRQTNTANKISLLHTCTFCWYVVIQSLLRRLIPLNTKRTIYQRLKSIQNTKKYPTRTLKLQLPITNKDFCSFDYKVKRPSRFFCCLIFDYGLHPQKYFDFKETTAISGTPEGPQDFKLESNVLVRIYVNGQTNLSH